MTLIKSISGIRGTIGGPATENLTPLDIVKFTTAYVRFIAESAPGKRLKIVVGRDARISGEMVGDIIEGTLLGCGADVVNVGLCTLRGPNWPLRRTGPTAASSSLHRTTPASGTP